MKHTDRQIDGQTDKQADSQPYESQWNTALIESLFYGSDDKSLKTQQKIKKLKLFFASFEEMLAKVTLQAF